MLGAPWWKVCDRDGAQKRFEELSQLLSTDLDPDVPVGRLSLGQQQQVEIIRALWHGELVLILDEPTSMLTPQGVHELGQVIRRLRDHGVAVIFITHKLGEAYELADCISVLRQGRVVGHLGKDEKARLSEEEVTEAVVAMMFGLEKATAAETEVAQGDAKLPHEGPAPLTQEGPPLVALQDATSQGQSGECPLRGASFQIWPGEVLGIAGVDGNGQKHLAEILSGQRPLAAGRLTLAGQDVSHGGVAARRRAGVRYITDERMGEGTVAAHPVSVNLVMKEIGQPPFWRWGLTQKGKVRDFATDKIGDHDIRTPSERTPIGRLSGGNIQKVLLAREMAPDAKLVIFNKPTYGLDLHNTLRARAWIREGAGAKAAAIVVISNELDELRETCHRIAVMYQGRIVGIVDNATTSETEIGRLMTGAEVA